MPEWMEKLRNKEFQMRILEPEKVKVSMALVHEPCKSHAFRKGFAPSEIALSHSTGCEASRRTCA